MRALRIGLTGAAVLAALATLPAGAARADGPATIDVTIKDHVFTPSEITVPAGQRVVLMVKNEDATAEEFDSTDLRIEKVIAGHDSGAVRLHPLDPGRYSFMGEYHSETAKGVVIAK